MDCGQQAWGINTPVWKKPYCSNHLQLTSTCTAGSWVQKLCSIFLTEIFALSEQLFFLYPLSCLGHAGTFFSWLLTYSNLKAKGLRHGNTYFICLYAQWILWNLKWTSQALKIHSQHKHIELCTGNFTALKPLKRHGCYVSCHKQVTTWNWFIFKNIRIKDNLKEWALIQ